MLNGKSSRLIHTFIDSFRLGFAEHRQGQAGIDLFRRMNIPSNEYTFTIMFKICAQLTDDASLELGHKMLKSLPDNYRRNTVVLNAALHMLMQRGQISAGEQLFNQMDKDNITHGTMMSGKKRPQSSSRIPFSLRIPDEASTTEGDRSLLRDREAQWSQSSCFLPSMWSVGK